MHAVREWVISQIQEDEAFLKLLLQLRDHRTKSLKRGYRTLKLASLTEILGEEDQIKMRIRHIKKTGHYAELVTQLKQAIAGFRYPQSDR